MQLAIVQLCGQTSSLEEQLEKCRAWIIEAKEKGAGLIAFPEAFLGPYKPGINEVSDSSKIIKFFCELAHQQKIWILAGTLWEKSPDPERAFNTSYFIDDQGQIKAKYRKIHLFDVELPSGQAVLESGKTIPGQDVITIDTPFGRVGIAVCFDLRFSRLFNQMSLETPLDLILLPSNFNSHTGKAHFKTLVKSRAIEKQAYILAPNQFGPQENGTTSYGHSLAVGPWGEIMAEGDEDSEGLFLVSFDKKVCDTLRKSFPLKNRL